MFLRSLRISGILAAALAVFACDSSTSPDGGGGGGGGGGGNCRIGPATYRISTTGPNNFTSTTNGSCTFNRSTVEGTCTNQYSDSGGTTLTSVSTTRNASIAQVIDEVSVIPPLILSSTTTTVVTQPGQPTSTGTSTRAFNGRRLVMISNISQPSGATSLTTYTAWDSSDRPTAGSVVSGGQPSTIAFSYNNGTRTQTITQAGVSCTQTFDQNGNPASAACAGTTSTSTILTTQQICP